MRVKFKSGPKYALGVLLVAGLVYGGWKFLPDHPKVQPQIEAAQAQPAPQPAEPAPQSPAPVVQQEAPAPQSQAVDPGLAKALEAGKK